MSDFGGISYSDHQNLVDKVTKLQTDQLLVVKQIKDANSALKAELLAAIKKSNMQLASHLMDLILSEDKSSIKKLQAELQVTAGAAAKSANEAKAIAQVEIDAAISLLSSKSYVFGHGE